MYSALAMHSPSPQVSQPHSSIALDYRDNNNIVVSSPVSTFSFSSNEQDDTNQKSVVRVDSVLSNNSYSLQQQGRGNVTQVSVRDTPSITQNMDIDPECSNEQKTEEGDDCEDTTEIEIAYDSSSSEEDEEELPLKDQLQQKWLKELSQNAELETLSILYAKSILDPLVCSGLGTRVAIGCKSAQSHPKEVLIASKSPPAKPRRSVTRAVATPHACSRAAVCSLPSTSLASSTISQPSTTISVPCREASCPCSPALSFNRNVVIRAPRILKDASPPARFAKSLPNGEALGRSSCCHSQGLSTDSSVNDYSQLPLCEVYEPKINYRSEKKNRNKIPNINNRPPTFRHSIRVNEDGDDLVLSQHSETFIQEDMQNSLTTKYNSTSTQKGNVPRKHNSSPKSNTDSASGSVDSGQCSGSAETSPGTVVSRQLKANSVSVHSSQFQAYDSNYNLDKCLPGYVRMASTMDHILRTSSAIYSLLTAGLHNPIVSKDLFHKTQFYIQIVRQSACAKHMPNSDIELVLCAMRDAEREANLGCKLILLSDYFAIVVRKMLEQSMIVFVRVICKYLAECVNKDRLLLIALEHMVHLLLFGDELCVEAIKSNAVDNIVGFCQMSSTPSSTLQLLLRNLAVLCGTSKGCLQLLSIGGFEVIIHVLCESQIDCSVEAAGVLTQLTNPRHSFVKMNNSLGSCLMRLLTLIDQCATSESLLLCAAALANLCLQNAGLATDLLYQYNAILRLIQAFKRPNCANIFVQEQIVTIFSRLASRGYEQALIAQGAIPVLLRMLTVADKKAVEYCKRIRYKAAVCLGTISSSGIGLKALFEHRGYNELCEVLRAENQKASPLLLICSSIKQKLESTYQVETMV